MRSPTTYRAAAGTAQPHLLQPLLDHAAILPDLPLLSQRVGEAFTDLTAAEVAARVRVLARGLIGMGIQAGDRVAIMSRTRLEWVLLDYAILAAGGVTVPIFETSSATQVEWILSRSGAVMAVYEDADLHRLHEGIEDRLPDCDRSLIIDDGALEELERHAVGIPETALDARTAAITAHDIATIIFTSGTTGRPKGCVLTHGNLRSNAMQVQEVIGDLFEDGDATLLFLPMAHSFAKILFLVPMELGMRVAFCDDLARLTTDLPLASPTWVAAVPRIFEKVYGGAHHKAVAAGRGRVFERAAETASAWSVAHEAGHVPLALRVEHALFDRLVYTRIREAFGSRLRFAFSGGGPLSDRLTRFFDGVGIQIYEGYGMTETSPVLTMNRPGAWRIGTVGKPVPGTDIRIAEDGEILVRGPQVFAGYWQDVAATEATFTGDGWLRTGDIGALDDAGYLRITGRKKELIVTAGGKNVAPAVLEDRLRAHPLISQALVVGDAMPYVAALVTIDEEALADWLVQEGRPPATAADLREDLRLRDEVARAVTAANAAVSRAESVRRFAILGRDFTVEDGDLTPTFKLKRAVLAERHAADIAALYS